MIKMHFSSSSKTVMVVLVSILVVTALKNVNAETDEKNEQKSCKRNDGGDVVCDVEKTETEVKSTGSNKYSKNKGHLQPFGESGTKTLIKEVSGFPEGNFFLDYVLPSIPLLMRGAATQSPAFHKWTDDYLLRLSSLPENRNVKVDYEIGKKEKRGDNGDQMTFNNFLKTYNSSDIYMVQDILPFMEPYLMMPCPFQCPHFQTVPMKRVMWFSSGGTKSVVHTDSEENFNCLLRGNKTLIMLDPASISTGSVLDVPESAHSLLDVDRVDLNRYPTLRGASFIIADMKAGDCLYIPHHWIHQVRSTGSNMAVNVWLYHQEMKVLLKKGYCTEKNPPCDPTFTLGRVKAIDWPESKPRDSDSYYLMRGLFEFASLRGKACVTPDNPPLTKKDEKVKVKEYIQQLLERGLHPFFDDEETDMDEDPEEESAETGNEKEGPTTAYKDPQDEEDLKAFTSMINDLDTDADGILTSEEYENGIDALWADVLILLKGRKIRKETIKAEMAKKNGSSDDLDSIFSKITNEEMESLLKLYQYNVASDTGTKVSGASDNVKEPKQEL